MQSKPNATQAGLGTDQPIRKPSLDDMIAAADGRAPGYGSSATGGPDDLLPDLGYPTARPEKDRE